MREWVDLRAVLGDQEQSEAAPEKMATTHGGVWWGVSPCPYGYDTDEDGNLVCRPTPREVYRNPSVTSVMAPISVGVRA